VATSGWFLGGWGGESTVDVVSDVSSIAFAVFATVGAGLAARWASGRYRRAWVWLAVAVAGWAIGSTLWALYEVVLDVPPFPSLADVGYLVYPVAASIGLALYPVGNAGRSRTRLLLDGLIMAAALFAIAWTTVLQEVYEAGGASAFSVGLAMAYPVGDLVVVTVGVLVLASARPGQRSTLTILVLAAMAMTSSDGTFAYLTAREEYRSGSIVDAGWVVGMALIGIAGLLTDQRRSHDVPAVQMPSKALTWLPYVPVAVAIAVCSPTYMRLHGMIPMYVTSITLVAGVLARQFFVIRENGRLLEVVAHQALRDPLTGLANRALFNDRLAHAVQLHRRDGRGAAVLSLDLDHFKLVNDSLGHPAGDALLVMVAQRIHACARTGDTVARVGGDEFAVLMEGRAETSRVIAHRVMHAFDEKFVVDGHDLHLRPSIGLAVVQPGDADVSAGVLLKQADVAMYSAKRSRTGGVRVFSPEMQPSDPAARGLTAAANGDAREYGVGTARFLGQLRHAIEHGELSLVYQPKLGLRDGDIVGVEALVRWPHPERGVLAPDQFLPMVREHGLMRNVTDLVVAKALDDAVAWQANGAGVPIAVNVFAPSLGDLTLPDRIQRALTERWLGSNVLTIEITEDLLLDNLDQTRTVLDVLRSRGIRVAIDDFGSGYSTLSYLYALSIDEVKLDRQFIGRILNDAKAAAVVRAVIDLAHVLGMTVVAEGVEDADTAVRLREYGCDVAQGFHYSRPLAGPDLLKLLLAANPRTAPASTRSS
jgi:diguanylate cyclase (GGDEF)-like protein